MWTAAIDNKTPKAWLISQKARDKVRRHALKDEHNRRNEWLASSIGSRPPTRDSDRDRQDLIAMVTKTTRLKLHLLLATRIRLLCYLVLNNYN